MPDTQADSIFRVLIVEDDESHAFLACEALARCGVTNERSVARNGRLALEQLRCAARAAHPHDLIFMDLNLPELSGREALAQLKQDDLLCRIPVVVLSTSDNPKDVAECYALGAASYICKPIDLEDFFEAVDSAMQYWCELAQRPRLAKLPETADPAP